MNSQWFFSPGIEVDQLENYSGRLDYALRCLFQWQDSMAPLLDHIKVTHERMYSPDQISTPQDKSPICKRTMVELSLAMSIFWATHRGMPRDVFHEYASPNLLDLPFSLMRIAQEQCGQAQMGCGVSVLQDNQADYP